MIRLKTLAAFSLYAGPFLNGIYLEDVPEFDR
jgi:hypothetical protein